MDCDSFSANRKIYPFSNETLKSILQVGPFKVLQMSTAEQMQPWEIIAAFFAKWMQFVFKSFWNSVQRQKI